MRKNLMIALMIALVFSSCGGLKNDEVTEVEAPEVEEFIDGVEGNEIDSAVLVYSDTLEVVL